MAGAETARLIASLELQDKLSKGVQSASKSLGGLSSSIAKSRAVAVGLGVGLERVAERGISALGNAIGDGIASAQTLEKAQQQTAAAIASTGGKAGVSAQQIRDLAEAQENLTTADDKLVQQGENLLLTFTNIGSTVFPEATRAMVNMAIAMNKGDAATADFDGTAIQLGKALNDPVKGFTALQRVGVSFNAAQAKILKGTNSLSKEETKHYNQLRKSNKAAAERYKQGVLNNKLLASQKLILGELNTEFGKAGAAAGTGFTADVNRARDAIEDAEVAIAQGLMPAVGEVARELTTTLGDPQVQSGLKNLGTAIGGAVKGLVAFAKTVPWGTIASSLQAAAGFAKDLLGAFLGLPSWVQTAVITGWGLNKLTGGALNDLIGSLASGLIKGVLGINAGVVNVNGAVVNGAGGIPGTAAGAAGAGGTLATLAAQGSVILAPATIAAIGLAVDQAVDPNDSLKAIAIAETAMGRGIADWNNKGIATLEKIAAETGDPKAIEWLQQHGINISRGGIEALRGAIAAGLQPGPGLGSGKGSVGDMESRRGQIGDDLFKAELEVQNRISSLQSATESGDHSVQEQVRQNAETISSQTLMSGDHVAGQVRSTGSTQYAATVGGTSQIVGAIQNIPAPQTTVNLYVSGTTVRRKDTVTNRGGDSDSDRFRGGKPPGGQ